MDTSKRSLKNITTQHHRNRSILQLNTAQSSTVPKLKLFISTTVNPLSSKPSVASKPSWEASSTTLVPWTTNSSSHSAPSAHAKQPPPLKHSPQSTNSSTM